MRSLFLVLLGLVASACAPFQQVALKYDRQPQPGFSEHWFTSFDGARLGLDTYLPHGSGAGPCDAGRGINLAAEDSACEAAEQVYGANPDVVIIAVHGMNDYAGAFHAAGAWWSAHGAIVYAYDQHGFGRSPNWML
jgi:alpha-beta hydrolase superfamily lysophospholipase